MALFWGIVFPTLVAGYGWGDFRGGFFYAAMLRIAFTHQTTFCINSVAHYFGDHVYADHQTPRDYWITAFLTLGEGYHNFHHEFPQDYRNAIRFYQYDPTKWFIRSLAFFGLTWNLHRFPENEIQKGKVQVQAKKIQQKKSRLDWGKKMEELPLISMEAVKESNNDWVVIGGIVYSFAGFIRDHPGGEKILRSYARRDATRAFGGEVYNHSNAAHNLLHSMRVARIKDYQFSQHDLSHERDGDIAHRQTEVDYEIDFPSN